MAEPKPQMTAAPSKEANKAIYIIFVVILVAILAVVFLLYKPQIPQLANFANKEASYGGYVILFKNIDLAEASAIVESLKSQGIKDYKLEDDGRTILVPRKKRSEVALKIASEGIMPNGGMVGFEIFDKGGALGATDFDKQIKFSRAISGELSRNIARIYGVEEARVQVVIPAKQLFSTVKNPVLAAVFVKIREGELLSPLQVSGIVSLVASSVEDLKKENVTVVDYYGRILSMAEYTKDYDRLAALLMAQKEEQRKKGYAVSQVSPIMSGASSVTDIDSISPQLGASQGKSFFDVYRNLDKEKREKQDKELLKAMRVKNKMNPEELLDAKLRFKEKYENILEKNIRVIADQFFPKNATSVKINIELNNLSSLEASPNSLISRMTTMILLDENNKNIKLTPENREALMKSVAAAIGYIKGRDRIDLRWAPMGAAGRQDYAGAITDFAQGNNKKPQINFNFLNILVENVTYVYYAVGAILLLMAFNMLKKKRKEVPADAGTRPSVFDQGEKKVEGFEDLTVPPIDKIKEMAGKSPERVAAVLEKWFQEDNNG